MRNGARTVQVAALGLVGVAGLVILIASCGGGGNAPPPEEPGPAPEVAPLRCLYNGYLLTANPSKALAQASRIDRHRLYVLHAVLIDPDTGRIAAVYPSLVDGALAGGDVARPVAAYPQLSAVEHPPAPGTDVNELIAWWRERGVPEHLLQEDGFQDLDGAVVTPGLIDDHFHVTSWSRKIPAAGETFGYWADIGDPRYYLDELTFDRRCTRDALWRVVVDANRHLEQTGDTGIFLHGYWHTIIDEPPAEGPPTSVFLPDALCVSRRPDPAYLLNRIGEYAGGVPDPDFPPCTAEPEEWPAGPDTMKPALLVHTSGQMCWFNAALHAAFNQEIFDRAVTQFAEVPLLPVDLPAEGAETWTLTVDPTAPGLADLFDEVPDFPVDVVVTGALPGDPVHVPFLITAADESAGALEGRPMLPTVADAVIGAPGATYTLVPFWRPVVACIPDDAWDAAGSWWEADATLDTLAYGAWDPQNPYGTNWYNGAERGLIQYGHAEGRWRVTGYAEHYVMRDMLADVVAPDPSTELAMELRRRLASWCHRHGLTALNDIMFYRRRTNTSEFDACWGLSYDHAGLADGYHGDPRPPESVPTGGLGLRLGLYYYLENVADVAEVLELARDGTGGTDVERLAAPEGHPEYPGWVRWLGWKLQLDGGTGARTIFTNAPLAKDWPGEPFETRDEGDLPRSFDEHSFGLLTMTNEPEQVLDSRETAALYWLVRATDPANGPPPGLYRRDWSFLCDGIVTWLDMDLDLEALEADLEADLRTLDAQLDAVELPEPDPPEPNRVQALTAKLVGLFRQVQSGWERTLAAIASVWFEKSRVDEGLPAIPSQVACHCLGDAGVDLWVRAIQQLRDDVATLDGPIDELPGYWQAVLPTDADLGILHRTFDNERFRVEHLLNVSGHVFDLLHGEGGLDAETTPMARNVVFSTQPLLLLLDGQAFRQRAFPVGEELWDIPHDDPDLWCGVPAQPRFHHHMPCPVFAEHDVPFTLNTDPPAARDPRPALTIIAAVARTPAEIDPGRWLDQGTPLGDRKPVDFLVGRVFSPLGLTPALEDDPNPMRLTVEQALSAMTFWGAYVTHQERELGAIAAPRPEADEPGYAADLVVWTHNPLAIRGPTGVGIDAVGLTLAGADASSDAARVATVNAFIEKFRPARTIVAGRIVYER